MQRLKCSEQTLYDRACRIHRRRSRRSRVNYDCPSRHRSAVMADGRVVLRNVNGTLAVVKPQKRVR
jgi:hypothetical protein